MVWDLPKRLDLVSSRSGFDGDRLGWTTGLVDGRQFRDDRKMSGFALLDGRRPSRQQIGDRGVLETRRLCVETTGWCWERNDYEWRVDIDFKVCDGYLFV